ncbi:bcl-2/adenovirus E1B 19 kDa-interacting protein 2-like protein isoform X2 [Carettochelys insculpta]|uniref:bcl-2/adenovirus E1B 19 kDa-interacting protein 2-like protein isoform X2 n=1 Tax=Carettochelys insculpta TaxID=44489 RepID=UPI003EB8BFDC
MIPRDRRMPTFSDTAYVASLGYRGVLTGEQCSLQSFFLLPPGAPTTLELCGKRHMKKRLPAPALSLSLDPAEGSVLSGDYPACTPDGSLDIDVDELETPSESEQLDGPEAGHDFEWEDDLPRARRLDSSLFEEKLSERRVVDVEDKDGRKWRIFLTDEREQKVDLSVVEPYKRVISHGGYHGEGLNAIILFASCYLPHSSIPDYQYVMEHLFRLRKNLKAMIIVHPTWYIKALMAVIRPFLSSKFGRKLQLVDSLGELSQQIPLEQLHIPDCVRQLDHSWNGSTDTER